MSQKEKIVFIINPKSGKKSKHNLDEIIHNTLDKDLWNVEIIRTERPGHATDLVFEYVARGFRYIIAVGGDGTVNEVATSVFRAGVTLGIVPFGSGNGLARFLKIPLNPVDALKVINLKKEKNIDVGSVNERFFFCTCGTGFDARIGHQFAKSKTRGFLRYVKTILKEFRKYRPKAYKIRIDNHKIKRKAFLVTIANAGQYGNNAYIAPNASVNDGHFDISILKPFPWYVTPFLGIRLFAKNIDKSRYLEIYTGHTVIMKKKKNFKFHIDGEPVKFKGSVKVDIIPGGLKILVP